MHSLFLVLAFCGFLGGDAARIVQRQKAELSHWQVLGLGKVEDFEDIKVNASGLVFDCLLTRKDAGPAGDVMLLHGFPEWRDMYIGLMKELDAKGHRSIACNQRGYSPGAAPDKETDYNYNTLREDIFAVADAIGFDMFHLVGHDHGGVLGWYAAGSEKGKKRFQSYTSLSIPHADAFSAGLFGPDADLDQQMASQYFSMFILPNSASIRGYFWYLTLGATTGFKSAAAFQKALWWYNGAMDAGALASPPLMSGSDLWKHGSYASYTLRKLFGGTPNDGWAAKSPSGQITMPAMYVCGSSDSAILCNRPYALKTADYCVGGYKYLEVDCGHDILKCGKDSETQKVIDGVVAHIQASEEQRIPYEQPAP